MKRIFVFTIILLFGSSILSYAQQENKNEIPMYGGVPRTPEEQKIDDKFIQEVVKQFGSREAAVKNGLQLAWSYYYKKNDPKTSMKRFNQVWLLDPNNADAFYGFAFLTSLQGKTDEAIQLYKKALELNPNHPMALANLARSYKDKSYELYLNKKIPTPDGEVKKELGEALTLYEKAIQSVEAGGTSGVATCDGDVGYIYYQWAVALEFNGEYAKAWEKIKLAKEHGGANLIESGFVRELSHFMPEPASQESVIKTSLSPTVVGEKNNATDTSSLSNLKLSATTASGKPDKRIAVINGGIYHIGDSVDGYKIDEIKDGCVVIVNENGDKHEIHI